MLKIEAVLMGNYKTLCWGTTDTLFLCNNSFENADTKYGGLISGLSSRLTDGFLDGF
jgi:hypothetical protein